MYGPRYGAAWADDFSFADVSLHAVQRSRHESPVAAHLPAFGVAPGAFALGEAANGFGYAGSFAAAASARVSPTPSQMNASSSSGFLLGDASMRDIEPDTPTERLSRHLPNRDAMDMGLASFNLTLDSGAASGLLGASDGHASQDSAPVAAVSVTAAASASALAVSENDSLLLYREALAEILVPGPGRSTGALLDSSATGSVAAAGIAGNSGPTAGSSGGGGGGNVGGAANHQRIGADVLAFGGARSVNASFWRATSASMTPPPPPNAGGAGFSRDASFSGAPVPPPSSAAAAAAASCSLLVASRQRSDSARRPPQRALNLNPEKVLDAPDLPKEPCQLLDWGVNNELAIGLRSTLYAWNANDNSARTVLDLAEGGDALHATTASPPIITQVRWLRGCGNAALCLSTNRLVIVDMMSGAIVRQIGAVVGHAGGGDGGGGGGGMASSLAVCGPLLAVASSSGQVRLFDVRAHHAAVGRFDAHVGPVAAAVFCAHEPHYLATGGGGDGCVRLWDYRNTSVARYSFDRVHGAGAHAHGGGVSSLCFFADKRSIVFSGGADGSLLALNTHARAADEFVVSRAFCGAAPITSIVSSPGTGEIATAHGAGAGVVQLRRAYKFALLGQFAGVGTTEAITCMTLAPDGERVCGAQLDETLKFWRVFDRSASATAAHAAAGFGVAPDVALGADGSAVIHAAGAGSRIRQRCLEDADGTVDVLLR
jgi:WD40 repeat protein